MAAHVGLGDLEPGPWWFAHEHPERPVDRWTVWSWDCEPCMIHLVASAHLYGSRYAEEFAIATDREPIITTIGETLTAARRWRAEQGLAER